MSAAGPLVDHLTSTRGTMPAEDDPTGRAIIPIGRTVAIGCVLAVFLALTVAGQMYLSMLSHGHSFVRLYSAELARWLFWAFAAPSVLRLGATLMAPGARRRPVFRGATLAATLILLHSVFSAPFLLWIRPLWPMEEAMGDGDEHRALVGDLAAIAQSQLPTWIPTDLLLFLLLLVAGNALAVSQRARTLAVRESRLEADLARAQLDALRLEIQPHFLFNTLNSIAALIRLNDNGGALKMLLGLSDLMRTTLDRPQQHLVPLASEIDFLQRYVELQQTRFADRLRVDYRVEDECRGTSVPTFLLQPLVENAIRHGARQARTCHVEIGARCEGGRLRVWVSDDGVGLPPGFDLDRHAGTGLSNTRSRLRQIYGSAASFDVRAGTAGGTIVEMAIPSATPDVLPRPA
jgi:two-component system LytT family sensor kinase